MDDLIRLRLSSRCCDRTDSFNRRCRLLHPHLCAAQRLNAGIIGGQDPQISPLAGLRVGQPLIAPDIVARHPVNPAR